MPRSAPKARLSRLTRFAGSLSLALVLAWTTTDQETLKTTRIEARHQPGNVNCRPADIQSGDDARDPNTPMPSARSHPPVMFHRPKSSP